MKTRKTISTTLVTLVATTGVALGTTTPANAQDKPTVECNDGLCLITTVIFNNDRDGKANETEAAPSTPTPTKWPPRHCKHEDGPGPCVWDAKHMGNGVGKSFRINKYDKTIYLSHARAHELAYG